MSEVRLIVREAACDWSGTIHGSCADRAIAALSADPVTMEELEVATERFAKRTPMHRFFANLSRGLCDEPYDAGLVVIDLIARLVVVDSTYSSPGPVGEASYHNGECCTEKELRYHLADDWLFSSDANQWLSLAEKRRRERLTKPKLDARAVFYGRPLLEFIARETFAAFARREQLTPETEPGPEHFASPFYSPIKQIHADWLLTPRADVGGACPREIALDRHGHIVWDLQDQCERWSQLRECPRGLTEASEAFRFGGFGTHELVKYYDLVRDLLWSCWDRLTELAQSPTAGHRPGSLTVGDFLTTEVPRLESVREALLDTPDPECHGRTPRSIIARERVRLPEGMSAHEAMVDSDCPCCQMMSEMPGPAFWGLDGSSMDDDFAFDIYCRTRAEWDEAQRSHEEFNRRFHAEWAERKNLQVTDPSSGEDGAGAVWSRSFSVGATADVPLGVRVFGFGCHLAELIADLRGGADRENTAPVDQAHIDQLNRDFGNLRELLQSSDSSLAEALIDPVLHRFGETLATVATSHPGLAEKCESLTNELHELLNPPDPESTWDDSDSELPF